MFIDTEGDYTESELDLTESQMEASQDINHSHIRGPLGESRTDFDDSASQIKVSTNFNKGAGTSAKHDLHVITNVKESSKGMQFLLYIGRVNLPDDDYFRFSVITLLLLAIR